MKTKSTKNTNNLLVAISSDNVDQIFEQMNSSLQQAEQVMAEAFDKNKQLQAEARQLILQASLSQNNEAPTNPETSEEYAQQVQKEEQKQAAMPNKTLAQINEEAQAHMQSIESDIQASLKHISDNIHQQQHQLDQNVIQQTNTMEKTVQASE